MHSVRQQYVQQQRKQSNTYMEDFFEVEINETDLFSNPDESGGNQQHQLDEEIFTMGSDKEGGAVKPNSSG